MAIITASAALTPLSALLRPNPSPGEVAVGVVGAATALGMTWFWLTRWPSRRLSLYSVVLGMFCAAAWSLTEHSAAVAALASMVLAITGGYIAFFHNAWALLLNTVVALGTAAFAVYRLAHDADLATAIAAFWLMWLLNIAVPVGIRGTIRAMSRYAIRSDQDPLTGLLNRRGFSHSVERLLIPDMLETGAAYLVVMMIDLDDFKRVNDTRGHAAGDDILLRVADQLRHHVPANAAVCRSGGEEFLVAMPSWTHDASILTGPLCQAIHRHCDDVSASIGVAWAPRSETEATTTDVLVNQLIDAADAAMYEAKRSGGNRVHVSRHMRCA
jgi:diguanylate cyclase (GGDEF)-like protein